MGLWNVEVINPAIEIVKTATPDSVSSVPEYQYLQNEALKNDAELRVEKQMLLPDLTVSYFNGTNRYG